MDLNDLKGLATGVLYIFLDRGHPIFPNSTSAHPSSFVLVERSPNALIRDGDAVYFPFSVPWDVWQYAVVPVLKDPDNQIRPQFRESLVNYVKLAWLQTGQYDRALLEIEGALQRSLQRAGFLPPAPLEPPPPEPPADGDPIVYPAPGDPNFPNPDGSLVWPEGHPRLVYPVVQ